MHWAFSEAVVYVCSVVLDTIPLHTLKIWSFFVFGYSTLFWPVTSIHFMTICHSCSSLNKITFLEYKPGHIRAYSPSNILLPLAHWQNLRSMLFSPFTFWVLSPSPVLPWASIPLSSAFPPWLCSWCVPSCNESCHLCHLRPHSYLPSGGPSSFPSLA